MKTVLDDKQYDLESKLQATVLKYLKELPDCKAVKISDKYNKGISDILICYKGMFVAIELKVGKNTPSTLQKDFLKEVIEAGGVGGVAYTLGEVKNILAEADMRQRGL